MDERLTDATAESEMTEEIVETIAQSLDADEFESRTEFAHEIIATLENAGYAVVPVEPTKKMWDAYYSFFGRGVRQRIRKTLSIDEMREISGVWKIMIAAAKD